MMGKQILIAATGLALLLFDATAIAGQPQSGLAAYRRGHYQDAADLIAPLAHAGDPFAQFALGVMHDDGKGMAQDFSLAFQWYMRAAEQGLVDAQHMVGKFYATGRGRAQNVHKAFVWFNLAAAGGYPTAAVSRDTMAGQMSKANRVKGQAAAASWQRRHPRQFSCREHGCIHATWLTNPKWRLLDRDFTD